jgi:hypothetical protein
MCTENSILEPGSFFRQMELGIEHGSDVTEVVCQESK